MFVHTLANMKDMLVFLVLLFSSPVGYGFLNKRLGRWGRCVVVGNSGQISMRKTLGIGRPS